MGKLTTPKDYDEARKEHFEQSDSETKKEPIVAQPAKAGPSQVEESCWDKFYGYSLLLWDGLGFFGFATSKLGRLRGEKVTFLTQL